MFECKQTFNVEYPVIASGFYNPKVPAIRISELSFYLSLLMEKRCRIQSTQYQKSIFKSQQRLMLIIIRGCHIAGANKALPLDSNI